MILMAAHSPMLIVLAISAAAAFMLLAVASSWAIAAFSAIIDGQLRHDLRAGSDCVQRCRPAAPRVRAGDPTETGRGGAGSAAVVADPVAPESARV
jgi:hypothetical protein